MTRTRALALVGVLALGVGVTVPVALDGGGGATAVAHVKFAKGDPDGGTSQDAPEESKGEGGPGPATYAEQEYAERAYPAADVPLTATARALDAWSQVVRRGTGGGRTAAATWTLAGPSVANSPAALSFSGADYTTAGRITALALAPGCTTATCRLWVAAAGGGVWRTDNALAGSGAGWTFVSGAFSTNAIGTLTYAGGVLYAGTGEPNSSGDSEAGLGLYRSADGGSTWTHLASTTTVGSYTGDAFAGRSVSAIVVDPRSAGTLYVSSTRGVRGVSSVTGGATSFPPSAAPYGLFKSVDGGATFSFVWDGAATPRGVNKVALDPRDPATVYAGAYQTGIWRSTDAGTTFARIFSPVSPASNQDRPEFAVAALAGGTTRMYVGDGTTARFFRTDDAAAAAPVFTDLTTRESADYCTAQCWYDNFVVSPQGNPDVVYLGGSFQYGEYGVRSNGRAVLMSTDGGRSFTDMTWDSATPSHGLHPDQHALVVSDTNPGLFFEGSDGGLVRSSGTFSDISSRCAPRGLTGADLAFCQRLLSRVPTTLYNLNKGFSTLQFQSLSVAADDPKHLMGGTQDNGTFETTGSATVWPQVIYGDGGQSGFSRTDSTKRFNSFFGQNHDANFRGGDPARWVIISGKIASSPEGSNFYAPIIADPNPAAAGTIFEGSQSVWRTQDWGGDQAYLEARCPEFTTSGADPACGDFVRLGPAGATDLTSGSYGSRAGAFVAAVERAPSNTGTLWVATNTGRVFLSGNADAAAASVTFTRLDSLSPASPGRFVSGIAVDPKDPRHAWVSYSGYSAATPATPGHVFEVTYDAAAGTATWVDRSFDLADLPVTDVVLDDVTGDVYASSDFGVTRLAKGATSWTLAAAGMPKVEVAGLTIVPGSRRLYAATHGRSAWALTLP